MEFYFNILERYGFKYEAINRDVESLPILFKRRYNLEFIKIFDEDILIISNVREISVDSIVADSLFLSKKLDVKIVIAIESLLEEDMKRLISNNVSFISSSTVFIPFLGSIIEEIKPPKYLRRPFTVNHQKVLIYMILNKDTYINAEDLSSNLNISIASVYRILKEFTNLGYIKSNHGNYLYLKSREFMYKDSKDYFINPIKDEYVLSKSILDILDRNDINYFKSGVDALSDYSLLTSNTETIGITEKTLSYILNESNDRELIDSFQMATQQKLFYNNNNNNEELVIQIWKYTPLQTDSKSVDIVSLSLLNIDVTDNPRIEKSYNNLIFSINEEISNLDNYRSKLND